MPVVYMDVVWLVNLVMDAAILAATGWIAKRRTRYFRILAGAFVGATYALLLFAPSLSVFTTWFGKAVVSLVMVYVALPCKTWLELLRTAALYYFVAFVFAGTAVALHYAIPGVSVAGGSIVSGHGLAFATSVKSLGLVLAIPLSYGIIRYSVGRARRLQTRHVSLYHVSVDILGCQISFVGLPDTGNQLFDPVSRKPVCLVDASVFVDILPQPIASAIRRNQDVLTALRDVADPDWISRITLVPYRGAGGTQTLAVAIRPDRVILAQDGCTSQVRVPCLLALHLEPLSVEGRFQAILHTEILTGDDGFEEELVDSETEHEAAHSSAAALDSHSSQIR